MIFVYSLSTRTEHQPSYYHYVGKEPLVYRTVGQQLQRAAEKYGDREAVVSFFQHKRYTYQEVLEKVKNLFLYLSIY